MVTNKSISRRRFLKVTAGTAGLAAAGGGIGARARGAGPGRLETVATYCDICFWKCGAVCTVRDGEPWKIEGNPLDPLSRGRLCPRGTGGVGLYRDPNRLRAPMLRAKTRGGEAWTEVTWDQALDYIAERMLAIKDEYGPEAMALFSHGISGKFFKHTLKAFGSPNITAPSFAQCRGPRDVGFQLTFGEEVGSPENTDIKNARCLVLIGSHLGENMHNTQVQEFAEAIANGASIICVDPRFSIAAGKAKHYLPIKPGTDIALLLAWMHVLVKENLYDRDYVETYGFGFETFRAYLEPYTPEWAFTETSIDPATIRETAREMARFRPATLVHPGRHATWYGNDAQRSRAIALLNALLGSWGRKGGFFLPASMDVPEYPYPAYPEPVREKADNPGKRHPFATSSISTGLREATITGKPYPIKGWLVYATNLIQALPNKEETLQAIQALDLMVVTDVIPTDTAGWADVVLPESTYLERHDDINVEWFREPFVAIRQPVVSSPHDQKPNWWIAKKLAEKLGLGSYYPWNDMDEYLEHRVRGAGLSYADLKAKGILHGERQPVYFDEGIEPSFPTPSGKIEFYSKQLEDAGFDPIPRHTPPEKGPPGSFRLLYGRAPVHSFSRSQSNPLLGEMMPENEVWLNADIARRLGFQSGDRVRLRNQDGILGEPMAVKATQRIRPDCVYMVHGFGHTNPMLKSVYRKGASHAQLASRYKTDPLMGGTGINDNFVTLEPEDT